MYQKQIKVFIRTTSARDIFMNWFDCPFNPIKLGLMLFKSTKWIIYILLFYNPLVAASHMYM